MRPTAETYILQEWRNLDMKTQMKHLECWQKDLHKKNKNFNIRDYFDPDLGMGGVKRIRMEELIT